MLHAQDVEDEEEKSFLIDSNIAGYLVVYELKVLFI